MPRRLLWALTLVCAGALLSGCSKPSAALELNGAPEVLVAKAAFPHDEHVTRFGLKCRDCHHETDAKELQTPHPKYLSGNGVTCASCHHAESGPHRAQACSSCHPSSPGDAADETLSAKVVIHQTCWRCHPVTRGKAASRTCNGCHPVKRGDRPSPPKAVRPAGGTR